jgi:ParB family chromosome partitioning protein
VDSYNNEDEEMQALIMLNVTNRKLTDSELMKGYEELRAIFERQKADKQVKGRIRELVAEALNVSNSQVRKIENINLHAVEGVRELIDEGKMSLSAADYISELDSETQKEVLADKEITENDKIKASDIKKTAEKIRVINDTKTESETEDEKRVINDTKSESESEEEKRVINDTKPKMEISYSKKPIDKYYTTENIRHALNLLAYTADEITTIIKCLENNTH